jgi:hypothetical protein
MPLSKEKMRDYMRERRKKAYKQSQPEQVGADKDEETGRYPDRTYKEDGRLVLFEQRCALCNGLWSASIEIPCPYCEGSGKRKRQ